MSEKSNGFVKYHKDKSILAGQRGYVVQTALIIYGEILGYAGNGKQCFVSRKGWMDICRASETKIYKAIQLLVDNNLITVEERPGKPHLYTPVTVTGLPRLPQPDTPVTVTDDKTIYKTNDKTNIIDTFSKEGPVDSDESTKVSSRRNGFFQDISSGSPASGKKNKTNQSGNSNRGDTEAEILELIKGTNNKVFLGKYFNWLLEKRTGFMLTQQEFQRSAKLLGRDKVLEIVLAANRDNIINQWKNDPWMYFRTRFNRARNEVAGKRHREREKERSKLKREQSRKYADEVRRSLKEMTNDNQD